MLLLTLKKICILEAVYEYNEPTQSSNRIKQAIRNNWQIAKISADGDYIFRGEPQCYCKASSALYRALKKAGLLDEHDIETFNAKNWNMLKNTGTPKKQMILKS